MEVRRVEGQVRPASAGAASTGSRKKMGSTDAASASTQAPRAAKGKAESKPMKDSVHISGRPKKSY